MKAIFALLSLLLLAQCSSSPPKRTAEPARPSEAAAMQAAAAKMEAENQAKQQAKPAAEPQAPAKRAKKPAPAVSTGQTTAKTSQAEEPDQTRKNPFTPKTMTKIVVRLESAEVREGSYAAKPRTFYRGAERFCRVEEAADPDNDIAGVVIMAEPDVWMVNLATKQGRHMVVPGPRCRLPIFTLDEIKSAPDLKQPLLDLEFGREVAFFKKKAGQPQAGPMLQGKPTNLYTVKLGDLEILLFSGGSPEVPLAVVLKKASGEYTYAYDSYEELPFNAKLFSKPDGVAIRERAVANKPSGGKKKAGEANKKAAGKKPADAKQGSDAASEDKKPAPAQPKS